MQTFNPDKIAEQYRLYKAEQAKRELELAEEKQRREAERAQIQAAVDAKRKPRKLRVAQVCVDCNKPIQAGEFARVYSQVDGGDFRGYKFQTYYRHIKCTEEKQ